MGFSKADFPRVKVNFDFEFNNNGVKKVIRNGIVYTIGFWRDSGRPVVIDMIDLRRFPSQRTFQQSLLRSAATLLAESLLLASEK